MTKTNNMPTAAKTIFAGFGIQENKPLKRPGGFGGSFIIKSNWEGWPEDDPASGSADETLA